MSTERENSAPDIRISDADRQSAVELLKNASAEGRITLAEYDERVTAAYAAKYGSDLEPLLADLPPAGGGAVPAVRPASIPSGPAGAPATAVGPATALGPATVGGPTVVATAEATQAGERSTIAIMSGHGRKGPWRPAPVSAAVAVMGGCDIDLREAILPADGLRINAVAIMGGIEITVPEGMDVVVTGISIMGGRDVNLADVPSRTDLPTLHVNAVVIMGGVEIRSRPPRERKGKQPKKEPR
jgi:hypothetical protein